MTSSRHDQVPWGAIHLEHLKAGTADLQPVVKTLRLGGITDWRPGWVRKEWEPSSETLAVDGTMFGGYIAALADQALAFAAMSVLPNDKIFRTIGLQVNFMRLARTKKVIIEAVVNSQSAQVINVEATFHTLENELFAKAVAQQVLTSLPK